MKKFNVRVYGIVISERNELLVTDELIHGREITKFPGGGLEFGEGTVDCIKREFVEETGQEIEVISHFYTTDFFQPSAFNENHQVISIYYRVRFLNDPDFPVSDEKYRFTSGNKVPQMFRWIPLEKLTPEEFTFPIDRRIAEMLL